MAESKLGLNKLRGSLEESNFDIRHWQTFILFSCIPSSLVFISSEEMNPLELRTERPDKKALDRYKAKSATRHKLKAAAKLWAAGLPWEKAVEVVHEAFDASTQKWRNFFDMFIAIIIVELNESVSHYVNENPMLKQLLLTQTRAFVGNSFSCSLPTPVYTNNVCSNQTFFTTLF